MHPIPPLAALVLVLASAGGGFALRGTLPGSASMGERSVLPPAEYFAHPRSFSELENARAELDARALRLVFEVRAHRAESQRLARVHDRSAPTRLATDVENLEQAARELRGTGWESVVVRDLFGALEESGRLDRWLDLYVETVLRQPTSPLAPAFASDALRIGRMTGRESELAGALELIVANPMAGENRARLSETLDRLPPRSPSGERGAAATHAAAAGART